jgi:hypothetical protein
MSDNLRVIPVNDLRDHESLATCWCRPTEDEETPGLFVHHSMDRREEFEPDGGKRIPS